MGVTVHFQPLADQVYVYPAGCTYDQRSPHILTMDATYSHQGVQCYLSNVKGEFTKEVWSELRRSLARRGVALVEYEHNGKEVSVDLLNVRQGTERSRKYRQENADMYSPDECY